MHERVIQEVRLDRIRQNVRQVALAAGPGCQILAVVKADAYGHGIVPVTRAVLQAGAARLGVRNLEEAIVLRQAGVRAPIQVLGELQLDGLRELCRYRVIPSVHEASDLEALRGAAYRHGVRIPLHVMVDTGMGRFGASVETAVSLALEASRDRALQLEGIATHFARAADADLGPSRHQLERFDRVLAQLRRAECEPPLVHAAASAALFRFPAARKSMVRPGLALYGLDPCGLRQTRVRLAPVAAISSRVALVRDVPADTPVSYGGSFVTARATRLAVVAAGYHDGVPRLPLDPTRPLEVLVRGVRCPVRGVVTMDYLVADVGLVPGVQRGDRVTLVGRDGPGEIRAEELAERAGILPYELLCRIGPRATSRYVDRRTAPRRRPGRQGSSPGKFARRRIGLIDDHAATCGGESYQPSAGGRIVRGPGHVVSNTHRDRHYRATEGQRTVCASQPLIADG